MTADFQYCENLVREGDKDRYLANLFAPAQTRRALHALHAFNVEVSRVSLAVTDPIAGEVRLQWWFDLIAGIARGEVRASPVAAALLDAIDRYSLRAEPLTELIDAHTFDLYRDPMPTLAALEGYARRTDATLFALSAQVLGAIDDVTKRAADRAGLAHAITSQLRSFAWHASRGQLFVPLEMLERHGVDPNDVLAGRSSPGLLEALRDMRAQARLHLVMLRDLMPNVPRAALPAFLPVVLAPRYLATMDRRDYDPFHTVIDVRPWVRPWTLWRASRSPARMFG